MSSSPSPDVQQTVRPAPLDDDHDTADDASAGASFPAASSGGRASEWWRGRHPTVAWSAWTLRAKLVVSMLALFMVLSLVTGAFTVVALNRQLTAQVDDQLGSSMAQLKNDGRVSRPLEFSGDDGRTDGPRGPGDEGLLAFFPASPTPDFTGPRGAATAATANTRGRVSLTPSQLAQIRRVGVSSEPTTLSIDGLGTYRVVSSYQPLYNQDTTVRTDGALVIGLPIDQQQRTVARMAVIAILTALVGILLVALLGAWIVRRSLEPLRRVAGTATRVSRMPLDSGRVALAERVGPADTDTRTEVGQVGAAFNEMLDHVDGALNSRHQSEQRVRQFVADASHELRTPLASIKGYAELSRRDPEPVPESVTHAMGRIESEANRMSSLVEDLLLLARLDAGRPLADGTVDLSMLVINAVSDAHAAAPDHRWGLDLPPEPVEVRGDPARLHQIVANLLGNARAHTPPRTEVTTSVRREGEWVRIAVHDNGPGVPTSLQSNVFERFARGDDARNRARGSTGLGLSIVSAVAKAHGGRVELASTPGDTTFSLLLPAHP